NACHPRRVIAYLRTWSGCDAMMRSGRTRRPRKVGAGGGGLRIIGDWAFEAHLGHQPSDSLAVDRPALPSAAGRKPSIDIGRPPGGQASERPAEPPLIDGRCVVVVGAAAGPAGRPTDQPDQVLSVSVRTICRLAPGPR